MIIMFFYFYKYFVLYLGEFIWFKKFYCSCNDFIGFVIISLYVLDKVIFRVSDF